MKEKAGEAGQRKKRKENGFATFSLLLCFKTMALSLLNEACYRAQYSIKRRAETSNEKDAGECGFERVFGIAKTGVKAIRIGHCV